MKSFVLNFAGSMLALIYVLFWGVLGPWDMSFDLGFSAILFFFLGIPHGAGDHLISMALAAKRGKPFSLANFMGRYLGVMVLYAVCWYYFTSLAFVIFIGISIFHFGDLENPKKPGILPKFLDYLGMICTGAGILGILLFSHWSEVTPILQQMRIEVPNIISIGYLVLSIACYLLGFRWHSRVVFSNTFLTLLVGTAIPLIPAFVLFFCVCHAVSSLGVMQNRLELSFFELYKKLLPFSLGAFLLGYIYNLLIYKSLDLSLVFIFLSLLTMPHFFLMHKLQIFKKNTNCIILIFFLIFFN